MALGDGTFSRIGVLPTWEQINQGMVNGDWEFAQGLLNNAAQAQAQAQAQQQAVQAAILPQGAPNRTSPTPDMLAVRAREMFLKRMGGLKAEMRVAANDFLQCHVDANKVYLFYCFGGRHGAVMEDIDMFPSDQLITQFRLVLVSE